MHLTKQQVLNADPKTIQKISFAGNLAQDGCEDTTLFFTVEEATETNLDFSQGTVRVL